MSNQENKTKILRLTGYVAGLFTIFIAVMMIIGYIQLETIRPLENPSLDALREVYDRDHNNEDIKEQIRALDLMARKAFFNTRWQIETGTYLLLAGALIFIVSQRLLYTERRKIEGTAYQAGDLIGSKRKSRIYLLISSGVVIAVAFIISFQLRIQLPNPSRVYDETGVQGESNITHLRTDELSVAPERPADNRVMQSDDQTIIAGTDETSATQETAGRSEITADEPVSTSNKPVDDNGGINYPFFRGTGSRGIVEESGYPVNWDGASGQGIKWKIKVNSHGNSSPIIWNEKLFLTGENVNSLEVMCYNKLNGELIWTASASGIEGEPQEAPIISEDTGLAAPTAATNGQVVCAIFATGNLICLDMNGTRKWAKNIGVPDNHYGHSSSLIIHGNKLLVQYDERSKKSLKAFDLNSGQLVWETIRPVAISWSSPVIARFNGIYQVILTSEPYVIAYDADTGSELWSVQCMGGEVGPSVGVNSKYVFAVNEFANLVAIKPGKDASIVWMDNEYTPEVSSPVATEELVYVFTSWGGGGCYDTETGELVWDHDFDYGFYASPVVAGNYVYLLDQAGVMHIVRTGREYSEVAESALGERAVCTPAFSEGNIYIRTEEHLYCIGN
jgi:outer membrane protein assembly factor BamB